MATRLGVRDRRWVRATLLLVIGATAEAFGQAAADEWERSFFFVRDGSAIPLRARVDRFCVAMDAAEYVDEGGAESLVWDGNRVLRRDRLPGGRLHIVCEVPDRTADAVRLRIDSYREDPRVRVAGPIFDIGGLDAWLSDEIILQFNPGTPKRRISEKLEEYGLELLTLQR